MICLKFRYFSFGTNFNILFQVSDRQIKLFNKFSGFYNFHKKAPKNAIFPNFMVKF